MENATLLQTCQFQPINFHEIVQQVHYCILHTLYHHNMLYFHSPLNPLAMDQQIPDQWVYLGGVTQNLQIIATIIQMLLQSIK